MDDGKGTLRFLALLLLRLLDWLAVGAAEIHQAGGYLFFRVRRRLVRYLAKSG